MSTIEISDPAPLLKASDTMMFRARAVVESDFNSGNEYCGASSGVISPGKIAREVFGDGLDFGRLFAYCFRRFGHPNTGSDDHKDIAKYLVTTPIKGLFLVIYIKPHSDPGLLFGYVMSQDLEEILQEERLVINKAWHAEFKQWRVAQGVTLERDKPGYKSANSLSDYSEFCETLKTYIAIVPTDTKTHDVNLAIKVTLEDLKTPVGVRDVLFSAADSDVESSDLDDDEDEDEHEGDDPRIVARHKSAGYFVPPWYFEKPERFVEITNALIQLGDGSKDKGFDALLQAVAVKNAASTT